MRLISRLLLAIIALIVIMAVASFFLPQKQKVERSIDVSASAERIYPYLANPKKFGEWSPWSKIDPNMNVQYLGAESGEGAKMTWTSELRSVGSGSWTIVKAIENERVDVDMDFAEQGLATSYFTMKPSGDNISVTWGFETDAGMNPLMRWMGLMMDTMVGTEYEKGLAELKVIAEKS